MSNREISRAWHYHDHTKHTYQSVRQGTHFLDWQNQPILFKIYRDLEPLPLPARARPAGVPALAAIASDLAGPRAEVPRLPDLAHLLHHSAGITRRRRYPGGEVLFRAASCTGALYEIELYLVCGALPDLAPGVYHFHPGDRSLRRLREGDFRGVLAAATAREPSIAHAPAIVISTGTYWRNAWKYRARTYRHFGWDNGTIHANLLAMASALGLPARLVCGFVDAEVNRLLGLNVDREVSLSLVALGHSVEEAGPPPEVLPLELATAPLSRFEVDYPIMREMHEFSSLAAPEEAAAWREQAAGAGAPRVEPQGDVVPLAPLADEEIPRDGIEDVILRRGSTRRFAREPITQAQLSTMLDRAARGIPADFLSPPGALLNDLYLIAHAVEGLRPGAYFYRASERSLEALKYGRFRKEAAYLALDQDLAGDAAVAVFFLADLHRCLDRLGNRGYRAVQLEAGILGGKLYLAAYALGLGATGLTFYDDDVVTFFSPHASGKSAIFLMALGHGRRGGAL